MSESEGSIPDDEVESSKYPIEGKFKSDRDRDTIMALPEIEREQILAERADELAKAEEDRKLRALFRSYGGANKKRKPSEPDLRDPRQASRVKTQKEKSMDELRRKREERGAQRAGLASKKRRSFSPDADADGDSEPEWDDRRRDKTPEERSIGLRDFEHIKIGYQNFAMVCFYPHFAETVVGCYVRLSVGSDPRNKVYRMAKIEEIVERQPYAMESATSNGRKFVTTQHIVASSGKMRREWPFVNCSQGAFMQSELDDYLGAVHAANHTQPKLSHLLAKNRDLHALIGHKFTNSELTAKVGMSKVLQDRYREHKKAMLVKQKDQIAEQEGEESVEFRRLEQQIANVMTDPLNLRYGTSIPQAGLASPSKKPGELTQQQRLAQLNRERAKSDRQRIGNALLQESRTVGQRRKAPEKLRGESPAVATPAGGEDAVTPKVKAMSLNNPSTAVNTQSKGTGTPSKTTSTPFKTTKDFSAGEKPAYGIGASSKDDDDSYKQGVKWVDGKPQHQLFAADDDWELPRPEWKFNYVAYSNNYLGSRSMHRLKYDEKGRAISAWPREITRDEVIARMDCPMPLDDQLEY